MSGEMLVFAMLCRFINVPCSQEHVVNVTHAVTAIVGLHVHFWNA